MEVGSLVRKDLRRMQAKCAQPDAGWNSFSVLDSCVSRTCVVLCSVLEPVRGAEAAKVRQNPHPVALTA